MILQSHTSRPLGSVSRSDVPCVSVALAEGALDLESICQPTDWARSGRLRPPSRSYTGSTWFLGLHFPQRIWVEDYAPRSTSITMGNGLWRMSSRVEMHDL